MYKNIVPLPEVSADPPVGPQINTSGDVGGWGGSECLCVWVDVLKGLLCWVHHSTHEQDGS